MPRTSPACLSRAVSWRSSVEGVGSPLGWLWTKITAHAQERMAGEKASRGSTLHEVRPPSTTRWSRSSRCFESRHMA